MIKTVNALKARQNLGQMLEEVYYNGEQFIVDRAGRPMAAVVPLWQLEEQEKSRERFFAAVDELHEKNKGVDPEVIERDIAEAVQAVRKKAARRRQKS